MKSKKWKIIIFASLAAILAEVLVVILLILPGVKINNFFNSIEKGEIKDATAIYRGMNDKTQKKTEELIGDYGYYLYGLYVNGDITFKEAFERMCNIADIDEAVNATLQKSMNKIGSTEIIIKYDMAADDYMVNHDLNSGVVTDFNDLYKDVSYRLTDDTFFDESIKAVIKEKYDGYIANTVEFDKIDSYVSIGEYVFIYGKASYTYVDELAGYMADARYFNQEYNRCKNYIDYNNYETCFIECRKFLISQFYYGTEDEIDDKTGFKEKFVSLKQQALEKAKENYPRVIDEYIADDNKAKTVEFLFSIDEAYGVEWDTKELWDSAGFGWIKAYADYINNLDENFISDYDANKCFSDVDSFEYLNRDDYISDNKTMLYYFYLYDYDGNGIPELYMRKKDGDHIMFFYIYDEGKVKMCGAAKMATFLTDGILTYPLKYSGEAEVCAEYIKCVNNEWKAESYVAQLEDGTYILNGETVSYEEANAVYKDYLEMQETKQKEMVYPCTFNRVADAFISYVK